MGFFLGAGAALLGGALGLGGSFVSAKGQKDANARNLQIAREQMDFQERMSNTAYTRATDDLRNAGLNRILALGSPASSPQGARATFENEAPDIQPAISTAMQAKRLSQELKNMKQVEAKDRMLTEESLARNRLLNTQRWLTRAQEQQVLATTKHLDADLTEKLVNEAFYKSLAGPAAKGAAQMSPAARGAVGIIQLLKGK